MSQRQFRAFVQDNPGHLSKTIQGISPRGLEAFIHNNSGHFSQRIGSIYTRQLRVSKDWRHFSQRNADISFRIPKKKVSDRVHNKKNNTMGYNENENNEERKSKK
jgi:hypothetical protein